ncbi:hypothetical protein [Thaumasiovibrio sp. DFM-14]
MTQNDPWLSVLLEKIERILAQIGREGMINGVVSYALFGKWLLSETGGKD